jgi:hypothetical protein
MRHTLTLYVAGLASIALAAVSRDRAPALQAHPAALGDSVTWDTSAWAQLQGARTGAITPLTNEPPVVGYLAEVFAPVGHFRAVARDRVTWDSLWNRLTSNRQYSCCQRTIDIDFGREMVVAAGNGIHQDGNDVAIVRTATRHDTLYVYVLTRTSMLPGCLLDGFINPVSVVRTRQWSGTVVFAEGREYGTCTMSSR